MNKLNLKVLSVAAVLMLVLPVGMVFAQSKETPIQVFVLPTNSCTSTGIVITLSDYDSKGRLLDTFQIPCLNGGSDTYFGSFAKGAYTFTMSENGDSSAIISNPTQVVRVPPTQEVDFQVAW